ncbi:MAG: PspC domain-containing protein [Bacteroidales bacterium]|nr:PspC domain-containing protein [Bacteroidales bacterium]
MKKTVTANVGGIVFHIDEDAYEKLSKYLNFVGNRFTDTASKEEIMHDIELRIAELLKSKTGDLKQVITIADIEEVIKLMGSPEDFESDKETESENEKEDTVKKLYRDDDNKIIGGVCSGIGAYFNTDPLWIRLIFVFFFFVASSSFWVYILLWIIVPKAKTTREKFEMRGKKFNVSNIEASIKEDLNDIKDKFNNLRKDPQIDKNKKKWINFVFNLGRYFVKSVGAIIGFLFIFVGIFLAIGLISSFFDSYHIALGDGTFSISSISFPEFLKIILPSYMYIYMASIGILLLIGIPLLMLIYHGTKLIFNIKYTSRIIGFTGFSLWIVGMIFCLITGFQAAKSLSHKTAKTEEFPIEQNMRDNFVIDIYQTDEILKVSEKEAMQLGRLNYLNIDGKVKLFGRPEIIINQKNDIEKVEMFLLSTSRGYNEKNALDNAALINYPITINDTIISLPNYYTVENSRWCNQRLKVILNVPESKRVRLTPAALSLSMEKM